MGVMNKSMHGGILAWGVIAIVAGGCASMSTMWRSKPPAPLFDDLGSLHHPITTSSADAQRYFDQGLTLMYAFNHAEAIRSFQAAASYDDGCAMCYWGEALAMGPNINAPMDPAIGPEAYAVAKKASALAAGVSKAERAYIAALAERYAPEPVADRSGLDQAYADAMREVASSHPGDLDAAALYAEALMDLQPWDYWTEDGRPKGNAEEIVAVLERVLERDPDHFGAIHFYIHAVEASPTPERAEAGADRLGTLVPGAGHLVHMPAHIYLRVGRYSDASDVNVRAADADESYITQCNVQGFYPALYYPHNIHFLWLTASIEGRSELALESARRLSRQVSAEQVRAYPEIEWYLPTPLFTLARFGMWDAALAEPAPPAEFRYHTAIWHYARGLALAAKGRIDEADAELVRLDAILTSDEIQGLEVAPGQPPIASLVDLAHHVLAGEIARHRGESDVMIRELEAAISVQDGLPYMEPPYWYFPVRQSLGAALLELGLPEEAELVYRRDLREHPHTGWSLFGLAEALRAQGEDAEAAEVRARFREAWARADVELAASRF